MYNKLTLAIFAALSVSAHAAEQPAKNSEAESVERIEITGSRIKGVDLEGTQPITILSAEDIERSGASSIYELLQDIPQLKGGAGTFSTSESGSTSTSTPAGQAAASLRGMGPSATLTLINGRRVAPSSFAAGTQNFVDVNSIPLAAIERVEILATGASAIYGADAVAGVINYILKKDFDGGEFEVSYGDSFEDSDESKKQINLIWGTQIGDGNLTVFADYYDRNQFNASDRDYLASPNLVNSYSYLPKLENTPNIYYYSSRDGNEQPAPGCLTELVTTEYGEQICAYYGNQDDVLRAPFESMSGGFMFNQAVGDLVWNTEMFYSKTKSTAYSTPAAINQLDDSEGPWVKEDALFIYDDANGNNPLLDSLYIDPFDTLLGQEQWGFQFDARFNDPRTVEVESENMRFVTSLEGQLADWDWETGIMFSESRSDQVAVKGVYNRYKFHAALAGELCSDGTIAQQNNGDISCGAGSLLDFYNPFLVGDSTNDATLALTQETPTRNGKSRVYGWDFTISGELVTIGDMDIQSSFGLEARKEELSDIPSTNAVANADNEYLVDVFGYGSSIAEAERSQFGAFAELYVPVSDKIEMQLAGRYDHFDDFGSTFNPKVSISYRPVDSVMLRAAWATSFRAPSLTQAGVKLRTTTSTFDCGANQAVADLYCEGDGTQVTVNSLELGNSALNAEESESLSLGFAWSPSRDTTITLDYWQFNYDDVIDTNMTGVLARAITDESLRHCGLVPNGEMGISYGEDVCSVTDNSGLYIDQAGANLDEILASYINEYDPRSYSLELYRDHVIQLENTGSQDIRGLDIKIDQRFRFDAGDLTLKLDATHYLDYDRNKPGSDDIEQLVGTFRYPENVGRFSISFDAERYYISLGANYTDSYQDDIEGLRGREIDELIELGELDDNEQRDVKSWTVVDLSAGYEVSDSVMIRASIDNLFDKKPPSVYGSSRGFDSINHDAYGTTYNLGVTYRF
ncbi:TonB-dependent receptor [Pseudoalteromonas piratica]|uniref:TonB-dependent receptor n=1 Tax=Pseudoalteromonas piratica TaxID=1348114 RepID=A0A0A7EIF8_9GAMM|nr:TonB-dependent receptor [Pseudoalteromonas piratica]AIY66455.1 TonB-dependent receptor [Pseudoalteromonas piratica]